MKIPYHIPYYTGREIQYIQRMIDKKQGISGDGYYTQLVTSFIEEKFNAPRVMMTTSATHALEMAAILLNVGPGDEVIMPSFTFPSTANAIVLRGGKPIFAEINKDTLNIDPQDIENKITERTKAIFPVHYGGIGCDMDEIMDVAAKYKIFVVEDAAQGVNGQYKNKYLGTIGHMGCYSFHGTKNYMGGEGGALLINLEDPTMVERAEIIRQKGTNRNQFVRGEVDKYTWMGIGSSYSPSDILMAFLYAQLQDMDPITIKRKEVHDYYTQQLKKYMHRESIKMIDVPKNCKSNYHLFYILFKDESKRDKAMDQLNKRGIGACIHFIPLHSSPMGKALGYNPMDLPITDEISKTILRLPMYTEMTEEELSYVVKNLGEVIDEIDRK